MLVGTFKLVHNFHVKSVVFLWRVSLGAVGLFDGDDGYLLTQDFQRNLLNEETHGFWGTAQCLPSQKACESW